MARNRQEDREYIPQQIRWHVFHECNETCAHCGKPLSFRNNFTLEHVIPLSKGGTNDMENFVALCRDCNKEKNNDIVDPDEYYTHLPAERKAQLKEHFANYLQNTDWLAYDTLFKLDRFDLPVQIGIDNPKARKTFMVPSKARVTKMRPEEVIEYFYLYGGRLNVYDKGLLIFDPDKLSTDYYRVTKGDKTLMIISPFIQNTSIPTVFYTGDKTRRLITLDVHCNPELIDRISHNTVKTMTTAVGSLLNEMASTLRSGKGHTSMECILRTPASDKLTTGVFFELNRIQPKAAAPFALATGDDDENSARLNCINVVLFSGDGAKGRNIVKETGSSNLVEFVSNGGIDTYQESVDERLSDSKEIKFKDGETKKKQNPKAKWRKKNSKVIKKRNMQGK